MGVADGDGSLTVNELKAQQASAKEATKTLAETAETQVASMKSVHLMCRCGEADGAVWYSCREADGAVCGAAVVWQML